MSTIASVPSPEGDEAVVEVEPEPTIGPVTPKLVETLVIEDENPEVLVADRAEVEDVPASVAEATWEEEEVVVVKEEVDDVEVEVTTTGSLQSEPVYPELQEQTPLPAQIPWFEHTAPVQLTPIAQLSQTQE